MIYTEQEIWLLTPTPYPLGKPRHLCDEESDYMYMMQQIDCSLIKSSDDACMLHVHTFKIWYTVSLLKIAICSSSLSKANKCAVTRSLKGMKEAMILFCILVPSATLGIWLAGQGEKTRGRL